MQLELHLQNLAGYHYHRATATTTTSIPRCDITTATRM